MHTSRAVPRNLSILFSANEDELMEDEDEEDEA